MVRCRRGADAPQEKIRPCDSFQWQRLAFGRDGQIRWTAVGYRIVGGAISSLQARSRGLSRDGRLTWLPAGGTHDGGSTSRGSKRWTSVWGEDVFRATPSGSWRGKRSTSSDG